MQAVLKAQINKTDRNDARGIAQMMRVGLYRRVHVKTLRSQKLRMLLTHCKLPITAGDDDDPARFKRSRSVGAYVGLTSRRHASGEVDWSGRISKCGDAMLRM